MSEDEDMKVIEELGEMKEQDPKLLVSTWSVPGINAGDMEKKHPFGNADYVRYFDKDFGCGVVCYADVPGDTWKDMWYAAEAAIVMSEDLHHLFIEGFRQHREMLNVIELITGS